jgi:DNA-binding winged helix-turn-helix (wHTH) protein
MSSSVPVPPERIEFSVFSLDLRSGELRKRGARLKLQERSFQVLAMLLEHPGELVSREQLRLRLWPDGTFVDFDHNINSTIRKLRDTLGDSAATPRFIETVGRRGYRFVYPVTFHPSGDVAGDELAGIPGAQRVQPVAGGLGHSLTIPSARDAGRADEFLGLAISVPTPAAGKISRLPLHLTRRQSLIAAGILLIIVVIAARWWFLPRRIPRVLRSTRLSFVGRVAAPFPVFGEWFPAVLTDGSRIYFSTVRDATLRVAYLSVAGGDEVLMTIPLDDAELRHVSPDGSLLLIYGSLSGQADKHLWFVPTTGGGPRRLGSIDGQDGAWSADGQHFLYSQGHDLFIAEPDGSKSRKLATVPGKAFWLRWSPDGSRTRFTLVNPTSNAQSLWECRADGSNLHRLPISWEKQPQECCGEWALDGKYFFFRTFLDARADLWSIAEPRFPSGVQGPIRLTNGPLEFASAIPSRSGKQLLTVGVEPKWEVLSYNLKTQHVRVWIPERSAFSPSTSRDGRWIAYVEVRGKEVILWRSRPDGSD